MTDTLLDCLEIETAPNPTHAVIWMHGLGADKQDFAPLVPELGFTHAPGVRFIFPNAPVRPVTINGGMPMRAWYDIYTPGLVRREDTEGLQASQHAITALIARENQRGVPTHRIVLAGFSQGCAMTLQTGLRHSERLAGLVGLSGYLPLAERFLTERHPANQATPIFLAHGTYDPMVALERAQDTRDTLQQQGYAVNWKTYPMPHSVCPQEVQDIAHFLHAVFSDTPEMQQS